MSIEQTFEKFLKDRGRIRFLRETEHHPRGAQLFEEVDAVSDFSDSDWVTLVSRYRLDLAEHDYHWIVLASGSAARVGMDHLSGWVFGGKNARDIRYLTGWQVTFDKWVDAAQLRKLRRKAEDTIRKDPLQAIRTIAWMQLI